MSDPDLNILGDISPEKFLKNYWQKKPCLIRQAISAYQCPISPEELAGLACDENVSSRLVLEKDGAYPWQVKYGPLSNEDFTHLPETHWTLLVQQVDHYHPEITALLDYFRFVPGWRIDDVMISYATEHGSVGPHLDSYDVFLLQGMGKRRWQINPDGYDENDFVPGLDLRILENFQATQEWILEPGDMLYLPPGTAHHGIAMGPCLTLSIGFLAPSRRELINNYVEDVIAGTSNDVRYTDQGLTLQEYPGEITNKTLASIRKLMRAALDDDKSLNQWFGKFITAKNDEIKPYVSEHLNLTAFNKLFKKHEVLYKNGDSRCAFIREDAQIILFVNGNEYQLDSSELPIAVLITEKSFIQLNELSDLAESKKAMEMLCNFYNQDIFYFNE